MLEKIIVLKRIKKELKKLKNKKIKKNKKNKKTVSPLSTKFLAHNSFFLTSSLIWFDFFLIKKINHCSISAELSIGYQT